MRDMKSDLVFASKSIDEVRDYWNSRPCNIRHSALEPGTREYFDQVEARKYFVEPHIPAFAEFPRWAGRKVLEIGCGIGTDTMNFARAGAMVTAVDLSQASLDMAKKRARIFGLEDKITFVQANAEKLDEYVPVEKYDLVYSFGVIHHTPHPDAVIKQVKKYLTPPRNYNMQTNNEPGVFKIMVYNRMSWKVFWILLKYGKGRFWRLDELIARYSEAQTGCPVTYSYDRKSLSALLDGMEISRLSREHIFPYSIPEYKRYEYKKNWYFRWMPKSMFEAMEHLAGWHLCAEARLL